MVYCTAFAGNYRPSSMLIDVHICESVCVEMCVCVCVRVCEQWCMLLQQEETDKFVNAKVTSIDMVATDAIISP